MNGLVVARYRRHVDVEDSRGRRCLCLIRGRTTKPLVGDTVALVEQSDGTLAVESIAPRRSALTRIDSRGRPEGVAANVSQLVVVTAPEPRPDWFLVDRYLAAGELMGADARIVWNKTDLAEARDRPPRCYAAMGYTVHATSTLDGRGIDALAAAMRGQRSVLVGQSGAGKSSLINAMLGEEAQPVGDLSDKSRHGRHTTTTAVLYRLPGGGELIDSPGVRQYAPHIEDAAHADAGFRDFAFALGACRFGDCRHENEPDCAVKRAVDAGKIDRERYASYLKLRRQIRAAGGGAVRA